MFVCAWIGDSLGDKLKLFFSLFDPHGEGRHHARAHRGRGREGEAEGEAEAEGEEQA